MMINKLVFGLACAIFALPAFSQSTTAINDGTAFGKTIAPQNPSQLINPSASQNGWGGTNGTAIPSSVPTGLGGFSNPTDGSAIYSQAKGGGLYSLGMGAQTQCANHVPGSDPLKDQECAAVNFMSNRCIKPSNGQNQIMAGAGVVAPSASNCNGTFGEGQSNFGFQDGMNSSDPIFTSIKGIKQSAGSQTNGTCTTQNVVTKPAEYETNICIKSTTSNIFSCSQNLNTTINTTQTPAQVTYSCTGGVLVGQYCQSTSTGNADKIYTCPAGYTLNGTNCDQTITEPATPQYACPTGSTLSGNECLTQVTQTSPAQVSGYSCPAGSTLSGTDCITTTTQPATPQYSCPAGQTLSGSNCIDSNNVVTPAQVSGYVCPLGTTLSGSNCITTTKAPATPQYACPVGSTLSGTNCLTTVTQRTPAQVTGYTCPSGQTLSGSTCSSVVTVDAKVTYSCPAGSTLNGTTCTTVTTTPAKVNYSCVDGSAPVNGMCILHSVQTSWVDNCGKFK